MIEIKEIGIEQTQMEQVDNIIKTKTKIYQIQRATRQTILTSNECAVLSKIQTDEKEKKMQFFAFFFFLLKKYFKFSKGIEIIEGKK